MASIARERMDIIERFPTILDEESDEALALRIMLGSPLKAEDVISLASRVGFKNRRYINLYPDLFESILEEKIKEFEDEHGPILKVFDIKSFRIEPRSIFANLSIPEEYRIVKTPQIISNPKFKSAIYSMLQNTHEIIKSNSRNSKNETDEFMKKELINEDLQVDRNLRGIELEKAGKINQAIKLYEKNLYENFEGSHPYTRLAAIYHKNGQIDEEIRVLRKAVYVYENLASKARADRLPKLEKYKTRLKNAEKRKSNKNKN